MVPALPLLLLVGVAASKHVGLHDDGRHKHPIITASQERRICADLCSSGLGGEPCGDVCFDLTPKGIPFQYANASSQVRSDAKARRSACPLLCAYRLGNPLCECNTQDKHSSAEAPEEGPVDFVQVCAFFWRSYKWALKGCPASEGAKQQDGGEPKYPQDGVYLSLYQKIGGRIDWNKWCNIQCENSNGGSACNCDLLPMAMVL